MTSAIRDLKRELPSSEPEWQFAQVLVRHDLNGFELRHLTDRPAAAPGLRLVPVSELRALAQSTSSGLFRPLKSAPNLVTGWRSIASSEDELQVALHHLYPGALADWRAAQGENPPITSFREFVQRQTGMYRVTQSLSDERAAEVIRACCDCRFCLKRRRWSVAALLPDPAGEKSIIPCLEPCAVFLEFARQSVRIEQSVPVSFHVTSAEAKTLNALLEQKSAGVSEVIAEADFSSPLNPRRVRLLKLKLAPFLEAEPSVS